MRNHYFLYDCKDRTGSINVFTFLTMSAPPIVVHIFL